MTRSSLTLALFLIVAIQVIIIGVAKIKSDQEMADVEMSSLEYREFKRQVDLFLGEDILESLESTQCTQHLWRAFQGENWGDPYCYRSYNHLLKKMGK